MNGTPAPQRLFGAKGTCTWLGVCLAINTLVPCKEQPQRAPCISSCSGDQTGWGNTAQRCKLQASSPKIPPLPSLHRCQEIRPPPRNAISTSSQGPGRGRRRGREGGRLQPRKRGAGTRQGGGDAGKSRALAGIIWQSWGMRQKPTDNQGSWRNRL